MQGGSRARRNFTERVHLQAAGRSKVGHLAEEGLDEQSSNPGDSHCVFNYARSSGGILCLPKLDGYPMSNLQIAVFTFDWMVICAILLRIAYLLEVIRKGKP